MFQQCELVQVAPFTTVGNLFRFCRWCESSYLLTFSPHYQTKPYCVLSLSTVLFIVGLSIYLNLGPSSYAVSLYPSIPFTVPFTYADNSMPHPHLLKLLALLNPIPSSFYSYAIRRRCRSQSEEARAPTARNETGRRKQKQYR